MMLQRKIIKQEILEVRPTNIELNKYKRAQRKNQILRNSIGDGDNNIPVHLYRKIEAIEEQENIRKNHETKNSHSI